MRCQQRLEYPNDNLNTKRLRLWFHLYSKLSTNLSSILSRFNLIHTPTVFKLRFNPHPLLFSFIKAHSRAS